MCRRLLQLTALRAFEVAARHRSLTKAAEELGVSAAAVHHQVRSLEESLGVTLLVRTGNGLELTQAAELVLPNLVGALDMLSLVTEQLRQFGTASVLTVGACPAFGQKWLAPRLARFKADFPDVELRLRTAHGLPDLANSEIDCAVVADSGDLDAGAHVEIERVLDDMIVMVASPGFLAANAIESVADLAPLHLIHDDEGRRTRGADWAAWAPEELGDISTGRLRFDSTAVAIEAAAGGLGAALAPLALVERDIAAGRLVRLSRRTAPARSGFSIAHLRSVAKQPLVAAFREWLIAEAGVARGALFEARRATVAREARQLGAAPRLAAE